MTFIFGVLLFVVIVGSLYWVYNTPDDDDFGSAY